MPSSGKTPNLLLNQWLGSDKPKKDDFNSDNQRTDTAWRRLDDRCVDLEEQCGSLESAGQALESRCGKLEEGAGELGGQIGSLSAGQGALEGALAAHKADAEVHVTQAEKTRWNQGDSFVMGTYAGSDSMERDVAVGFRPRFGFVYAVGGSVTRSEWDANDHQLFTGFFGTLGCSEGVSLLDNGFRVAHNPTRDLNGNSKKYNDSRYTYVYVVWK